MAPRERPLAALALFAAASVGLVFVPIEAALAAAPVLLSWALLALPPRQRTGLLVLHATTLTLGATLYALALPHGPALRIGPALFGLDGLLRGLLAMTRLAAFLSLCALATHYIPARSLLPLVSQNAFLSYVAGSLIRLVPTLRQDARRIREAQALRGLEVRPSLRGLRNGLALLVPLLVSTLRRAREQARSLRLAGLAPGLPQDAHRTSLRWAIVPALAALAIAGRLALVSLPNISLSFFVLFLAGVAYGPRVGALVGLLSRLGSDLVLTGLNPVFLAMAPVDAFLGALAGWIGLLVNFGQRAREPYLHAAILAGTLGWMYTFAFSIAADTSTWLLYSVFLPGLGGEASTVLWTTLVLAGIAFNVVPAIFNAVVFGTATYPVLRALRAADLIVPGRPARANLLRSVE